MGKQKLKNIVYRYFSLCRYLIHRKHLVIGGFTHRWCSVPVPANYPLQSQTHPSILALPQVWNNFQYWLATTPYPMGLTCFENPCLYHAAGDLNQVPSIFEAEKNPIVPPLENSKAFNSDVELFFKEDKLYLLNRVNYGPHYERELDVYISENAKEWKGPIFVMGTQDPATHFISPSILSRNGHIYLYTLNSEVDAVKNGLCGGIDIWEGTTFETPDFKPYALGEFLNLNRGIHPWHCSLFPYKNKLYMIFCGRDYRKKTITAQMETYLAVSDDFINFTIFEKPIIKHIKTYRPSAFVDAQGVLNLYFSVVGYVNLKKADRSIGLTSIPMETLLKLVQP
ncbi:MAG: hypothetical protein RSC04_01465 [Bacteroidales bacterium]